MYFLYKTQNRHIISTRPLGQVKKEDKWELLEVFKTFDQFLLTKERRYKDIDFEVDEKEMVSRKKKHRETSVQNPMRAKIVNLLKIKRGGWKARNYKKNFAPHKIKIGNPNSFRWIVMPDGTPTRMWLPRDADIQEMLPLGWLNTRSMSYRINRAKTDARCREIDNIVQEYIGYLARGEEWPYS